MIRARAAVVALLSMSVVSLEVLWTRIFAAEYFYTFAFLILSLAVLGLGLGALAVRLSPTLANPRDPGLGLLLAAVIAAAGPWAVLRIGLVFAQLYRSPAMIGRFVAAIVILGAPFFLAGIALARIFRIHHDAMPTIYMADLVGASVGAAVAVLAMNTLQVPLTAVLACVPVLVAAVLATGRVRPGHVAALLLLAVAGMFARPILTVPRKELGPVIAEHWDAMGRLKIHDMAKDYRNLNIENAANSPVIGFDGDLEKARAESPEFLVRLKALLGGRDGFVLASLGAGGGSEVLQGLVEGASEVHAIEVNPAINRMLTTGELAEFSGRIYADERVRVVSEDGRTYLRRHPGRFDVILSSSSNTFAALASGAFAMSENYLFTTEAFVDYLRALVPGGFLVMEHQFYVPRAISEATDALRALGAADPASHIAVYELPKRRRMVLLVSNMPLDRGAVDVALGPLSEERAPELRLLHPGGAADSLAARIIANGWRAEQAHAPFDISPVTDDRPFIAHMGLWRNFSWAKLEKLLPYELLGFPVSKLIMATILAVAALLALPLAVPRFVGVRLGAAAGWYFAAIGIAYMAVEVVLIQQLTLLVGSSSYSLVTVLASLLLASGIGSRCSVRFRRAVPFVAILAWLALDILLFPSLVRAMTFASPALRSLAAVIVVLPLGFFMGMPFPKATTRVGERIDWGFAVNGVASVAGSTAAVLVATEFGFRAALAGGGGFYALALVLLLVPHGWAAEARSTIEPGAGGSGHRVS